MPHSLCFHRPMSNLSMSQRLIIGCSTHQVRGLADRLEQLNAVNSIKQRWSGKARQLPPVCRVWPGKWLRR